MSNGFHIKKIQNDCCSVHKYEEKNLLKKIENGSGSEVEVVEYGTVSSIGRRRTMEDSVTVVPGLVAGKFDFFAVYDGHGGFKVADACHERLHHLLEEEIQKKKSHEVIDWEEVMLTCFAKMDEEMLREGGQEVTEMTTTKVGSTAVVVVVGKEELVVANCGDSRTVLCRDGVAVPLSHDHKPDRPDETKRIEDAGGRIINWNGWRVEGVLSTSRSIGDHYLRPYVISEPEVTQTNRTESDEFLIVATDGLWDVMSNEFACHVVTQFLDEGIGVAKATAGLVSLANAKGNMDNISVIVVELKKRSVTY